MDTLTLPPMEERAARSEPGVPASLARALAASDGLGVAVCDRAFRYLLWNRFMEEMTGLPAAAVLGRDALEVHPHLRGEGLESVLHRVLAGETVSLADRRLDVPGFRAGWVWTQYHPHRLPDGSVAGVVGLVHDVTQRVRAEEETQRLAAFLRATPSPAVECDGAGRVRFANPAAQRLAISLGSDGAGALLPPGHADLVRGTLAAGSGVHQVEVTLGERILAWSYHPHAPLDVVHCLAEDVTERRRAEERLRRAALHDALTGLPNRRHFDERLAAELELRRCRARAGPAVCLLDLDRFKLVNDSLGHAIGDRVIVGIARRLAGALPGPGLLARWEGDAFAILLDTAGEEDAVELTARLQQAVARSLDVGGHELRVAATAGVAIARCGGGSAELLRDADTALHHAKARGACRAVFDAPMRAAAVARLRTATELERALERDEIGAFFQPLVSLETGCIVGAEALARWRHPERGWLAPAEFVAAAEESDLILALGQRVLERACVAATRWPGELTVGVNLSVRQLFQRDLATHVRQALAGAGLAPRRLRLEVTESVLATDPEAAGATLARIRALGVGVWMDDFGTGYSSLANLHRLPVDGLKIDRASVRAIRDDPRARGVVRAIVGLAGALDLGVVAEGIEDPGDLEEVRACGCGTGQGFLFSVPLEDAAFRPLLAGGPRW